MAIFRKISPPKKESSIIISRDAWKELAGHHYHQAIRNLGMQKARGEKEKLEAFGFKPFEDYPLSMAQGDRGLMPLQRIKGV